MVTDVGTGSPMEESLKRCLVATRLARSIGCSEAEVHDVVYAALLEHLGCTAFANETAAIWYDDVASTRQAFLTNWAEPRDLVRTFVPTVATATGQSRPQVLARTVTIGRRAEKMGPPATCEVARDASRRLGLPQPVNEALAHVMAMWNGKGFPVVRGEELPLATRIMHVAATAVLFGLHTGTSAAMDRLAETSRNLSRPANRRRIPACAAGGSRRAGCLRCRARRRARPGSPVDGMTSRRWPPPSVTSSTSRARGCTATPEASPTSPPTPAGRSSSGDPKPAHRRLPA